MINFIKNSPFIFLTLTCLLFFISAGMFFSGHYINASCADFIIITLFLLFLQKKFIDCIVVIWVALLSIVFYLTIFESNAFLLIIEISFVLWHLFKQKKTLFNLSSSIICLSFLLHLYYIQSTKVDFLQHDLSGIFAYINKLGENGFKKFNPWYMYYTFHQPLNFILQRPIQSLGVLLFDAHSVANEGLQYLSLFYVTSATIFVARILALFKFNKITYLGLLILYAFNPTLFLFTGYISNDVAVLFWSAFTIYYLLMWYKKDLTRYILLTAIGFGLGTLSKLSMLLYVPAISFVFLFKLLKKDNKEETIKAISLFIIVAVPISLLWIIRNHILFDMQFYNIPDTSPGGQNFHDLSLFERLTDVSMLFTPFINAPYINDANMILAIIKTELFGEWDFRLFNRSIEPLAIVIYFINIMIKTVSFIGFIKLLFNLKTYNNIYAILFITIWVLSWGYMIKYTMDLPYVCSSDYRLFTSIMLAENFILGSLFSKNKTAQYILLAVSIAYAMMSSLIYVFIS